MLYNEGLELKDGKALPEEEIKLNGRVGNHLSGFLFSENFKEEDNGIARGRHNAVSLYCNFADMKSAEHWTEVLKP